MKCIELLLAVCAFATGMLSALYWLKASKVSIDPGWGKDGMVEPGVHALSQEGWIAAALRAWPIITNRATRCSTTAANSLGL